MAKPSTLTLGVPPAAAHMLTACVAAARADAQRFFSPQRPPAWKPRARHRTRWWLLGALALATGGVAATVWHRQAPQVPPMRVHPPHPATHPALLWDLPDGAAAPTALAQAPAPVSSATPTAAPPPAQGQGLLERLGNGELHIRLDAHDRLDAAMRLAALTGARLLERPEALAQTRPVTLRWQGRDAAGAWRALLADDAQYLLDCRVERACKVWIVGAERAQATGDRLVSPAAGPAPASLPGMAASPEAPPEPAFQPDPPRLYLNG